MSEDSKETGAWRTVVSKYQRSSNVRALWQLINTLGPYTLLWVAMYFAVSLSYWLVVPLAVLAGAFLVRVFIIFHDCTHGAYVPSKSANAALGTILGVLVFTSYHHWRWEHLAHHAGAGNLDRRGMGAVWTLTVREYIEASWFKKFSYRIVRNPLVLFVLAPVFLFAVLNRIPRRTAKDNVRIWTHLTTAGIVILAVCLASIYGVLPYIIIQSIILAVSSSIGVWLFYVQHQFEDVNWERQKNWDFVKAALHGSSYYKLPKLLQWISGNIGLHHIHHLSPYIPNYRLQLAQDSEPLFQNVEPMTLLDSLKAITLHLWDEDAKQLVPFSAIRSL